MKSILMHTEATQPERAASRHGFPLPLSGVFADDIRMLLKHAPVGDAQFHITWEGELFAVTRTVSGDTRFLFDAEEAPSTVAVYEYQPAALDTLIGRQEPAPVRAGTHAPASAILVIGPATGQASRPPLLVTIADTYRRI